MTDVEKDEARELLLRISQAISHMTAALSESYQARSRITQDEKIAMMSWCASGGDSLKNLALLMFATGRS